MLYDSVHGKLLTLPDSTKVYPAHGAGSLCGKAISRETVSTIGDQRRVNYALQPMTKERFIELVTADQPDAPAWADFWRGPPFVVYGHTPRREIYKLKWSLGIDTGCVLGGRLTAYVLPEKRFIQVKARQRYWP